MKSKNALREVLRTAREICWACGTYYGTRGDQIRCDTYHQGVCNICGTTGWVTTPNDFGTLVLR